VGPLVQILAHLPRDQLSLGDQLPGIKPSLQGGDSEIWQAYSRVRARKQNGKKNGAPTTTLFRTSVVIEGNTLSS